VQTYTHILIGAAVGACLDPADLAAQGARAAGAMLPDAAQVPSYLLDRLKGRKPLAAVSRAVLRAKFAAHSLIVWSALLALAFTVGGSIFLAFCVGGLSHPLVDLLTHKTPSTGRTTPGSSGRFRSN